MTKRKRHPDDFRLRRSSRVDMPEELASIFLDDSVELRHRLMAAKVIATLDRNNIAREAVRSRAELIIDEDQRNEELGRLKSAEELRRDPEYLEWLRERGCISDTGRTCPSRVARRVGLGSAS